MDVIRVTPRGYCYGVVDAIHMARKAARDHEVPKPVHVLGMIVHNRHVVDDLAGEGVITLDGPDRLELLDQVDAGTVIFTAHGVSPAVKERAKERGLHCIDATCPDVYRTHDLIREKVRRGYEIIYVGKKGHPEPEGAMGEAPDHVHLVERVEDVQTLSLRAPKIAVTTQTTMSQWDTAAIIDAITARFPQAEVYNEICHATQSRQEAVAEQAAEADLVLVVGDERSNNSNRLVEVAEEIAGKPAYLVGTVADIRPAWLAGATTVAVTAGASTPTELTREVIEHLEDWEHVDQPSSRART